MAPAKSTSSTLAAKISSSLSSPVSLLWAHQLRREHSALLARIEGLTSSVNDVSARLDSVSAQASNAENKAVQLGSEVASLKKDLEKKTDQLESEHGKLKKELERSNSRQEALEKETSSVVDKVGSTKELMESLHREIKAFEQRLQAAKIKELKTGLPDIVNKGVSGVKDSMDELREQMKQIGMTLSLSEHDYLLGATDSILAERRLSSTDLMASAGLLQASNIVPPSIRHDSEETEDILTLRPNITLRANDTPLGDIDLDEGMLPWEPTSGRHQDEMPRETMTILPAIATINVQQSDDLSSLKQGKFQGWDRYLEDGQAIVDKLAKRKQGAIVELFVDGIYDVEQRGSCEQALDAAGWTWENVVDWVHRQVVENLETQARQRTKSLSHKHKKSEVRPLCSKEASTSGITDSPAANMPVPPSVSAKPVEPIKTSDTRRRSQRIVDKRKASQGMTSGRDETAAGGQRAHMEDKTPSSTLSSMKKKAANAGKFSQTEAAKGSKVQQHRAVVMDREEAAEALQRERRAKRPGDAQYGDPAKKQTLHRKGLIQTASMAVGAVTSASQAIIPRTQIQQNNLELVKKDRSMRGRTDKATKLLSNTARAQAKPELPITAKLNPVTPLNTPTYHQRQSFPSDERDMDSTKKRKLIHQLEPAIAKQGLVTPVDKAVRQTAAREPERKKRKKKRRAPSPIPMIPILPLTDEEDWVAS